MSCLSDLRWLFHSVGLFDKVEAFCLALPTRSITRASLYFLAVASRSSAFF